MTPLLEVKNLEVAFFTKDGVVRAVNGVSFTLNQGDVLGIVGESGCGKSTAVLSMLRLLPEPPARIMGGEVIFQGRDLLGMKPGKLHKIRGGKIAMVFQDPTTSLNPVKTVGDQIAEAMRVNLGLGQRESQHRSAELLERVGIPDPIDRLKDFPHQLSTGMCQRVMIATAISCDPEILIADEPTTALDVTIQAQIIDLVKELQEELDMTVIWITHNLGVIARLASRVNVMYAGYLVEKGSVKRLFENPLHPYTDALMGSVPNPDVAADRDLSYIEGSPPVMLNLPSGCPFWPRCPYCTEQCTSERPQPVPVGDGRDHQVACWNFEQARLGETQEALQTGKG